jgi:hypothetical protein
MGPSLVQNCFYPLLAFRNPKSRGEREIVLPQQNRVAGTRMIAGFLKLYFSTLPPQTFENVTL